jgi:hypothetical protein
MNIAVVMITCPGREELCRETLAAFDGTDWPRGEGERAPVCVVMDTSTAERKQERQEQNALKALKTGLGLIEGCEEPAYILFLEDDLIFNPHLAHNLRQWKPLREGWVGMASLYNPTIKEAVRYPEEHYFEAVPECVYGSQAYLFSRACGEYIAKHWSSVPGMQDIKMSRLAARGGWRIFYHVPCLAQHVGKVSAWGGPFHWTREYDEGFKAEVKP